MRFCENFLFCFSQRRKERKGKLFYNFFIKVEIPMSPLLTLRHTPALRPGLKTDAPLRETLKIIGKNISLQS